MFEFSREFLANMAILAICALLLSLGRIWLGTLRKPLDTILFGLVMSAGTVRAMMLPFALEPGAFVDLRAAFLSIAAFYGGPVAGGLTAASALTYRVSVGGFGLWPGVAGILLPTLVGSLLHRQLPRTQFSRSHLAVLAPALAAAVSSAPVLLIVHSDQVPLYLAIATELGSWNFAATALAGIILRSGHRIERLVAENYAYRTLVEQLPDSLNAKDLDGRFIVANPATAALMRATGPDALIGRTDFDFYPADVAERFLADERHVLESGTASRVEQMVRHEDGSAGWVSTIKAPFADARGRLIGLITHNHDITAEKQMAKELEDLRQMLASVLAHVPDGIALFDRDRRLQFHNDAYLRIFSLSAHFRQLGAQLEDIVVQSHALREMRDDHLVSLEEALEDFLAIVADGGERLVELSDGRWMKLCCCPITEQGTLIIYSDVTALKLAEQVTRTSEERWNFALESAGQGVWDFDQRTGRTFYSRVWKALLGYEEHELGDARGLWLELMHPDDRAAALQADRDHLAGLTPISEAEFRLRHKDGHWIWVRDRGIVLEIGPDGHALRAVGTHTNITAEKLAADELRANEERFRSIFALSPTGKALVDLTTRRILMQSQSLCRLIGLDAAAMASKTIEDLFVDNSAFDRLVAQLPNDQWQYDPIETELLCVSGGTVVVEIAGAPIAQPDGTVQVLLVFNDVSERHRHEAELWDLANLDKLTGLANRMCFNSRFQEALERAGRVGKSVGLALFDIDHFKSVNDSFGHDAGDELLLTLAERVGAVIRRTDTFARLGGDEFALILEGADQGEDLFRPLEAVLGAIRMPVTLAGASRQFSSSIGVAVFPTDAATSRDLVKAADLALYKAKENGRNRVEFFQRSLRETLDRRAGLLDSARVAVSSCQVDMVFEPIHRPDTMACIGFEALLQLKNPAGGLLSDEVLAVGYDDPALARQLSETNLRLALAAASTWERSGVAFGKLQIGLRGDELRDPSTVEAMIGQLKEARISRSAVTFVIDEVTLTGRGGSLAAAAIHRLEEAGVGIAIDGFGTGNVALGNLLDLPIEGLKLSRELVFGLSDDPQRQALAIGITDLAHRLGIGVGAASVDRRFQIDFLAGIKVKELQGSWVGAALRADQVPAYLANASHAGNWHAQVIQV
jgi:diguanylate cyclase (GGDEF)-like protein/PAS domain S-box-containing protein